MKGINKMKYKNKIRLSLVSSIFLVNSIYAKDVNQLDTVTVTAQKVEENIQEVPISMSVFDEFSIIDRKIESIKDIAPHTSNFVLIDKAGGFFSPSVRGISSSMGAALSSPTSIIVDGIPVSNSFGFDETLMDIERIEVLKGPQGTLYGKEAQAGVINVISKKPNNEKTLRFQGDIGSDNKREYSLSASTPIVKNKLYLGISAKHYEKDGFIKNTTLGGYFNDKENDYARANLRYTPNEKLEISLISSKLKYNNGDMDSINTNIPNNRSTSTDTQGFDKSSITAHALKVSYDMDDYLIESITTYRNLKTDALQNYTNFDYDANKDHDKYSQEFRISNSSDTFKWVAGIYKDKDEVAESSNYIYPSFSSPMIQTINNDSLGLFFHTDYSFNDKVALIVGARYDKDKQDFEDETFNIKLDQSNNEVSPKLSLKYQHNENSMYYSTISKGYRAGGFHPYAPSGYSMQYDREVLWNYEVGAKNTFLNNRLIVNSSIFYMKIDDMQVKVYPDPNSFRSYIANAASATSKGFEIELNAKLTDTLDLFTAYGYVDASFDKYKDSRGDYSGNNNIFAPKYNYNLGLQYRDARGYFARTDINGYGKTYFNPENTNSRDAYYLVNTKLGYETKNYDIYLYGKNIFDKKYDSVGMYNDNSVIFSPPREIGIQLAYRF